MGMGKYDSSKIRVEPVFAQILKRGNGAKEFLSVISAGLGTGKLLESDIDGSAIDVYFAGKGGGELATPPNPDLIDYLLTDEGICHLKTRNLLKKKESGQVLSATERARFELIDPKTRDNQRKRAQIAGHHLKEFLFEGMDYPDVVFVNDRIVLIVEGKLTEPRLTTQTTWLTERDQMIRHLDSAMACKQFRKKKVLGMYIVGDIERDESIIHSRRKPDYRWADYDKDDYWKRSLPHYAKDVRRIAKIKAGFLGHMTWHELGAKMGGLKAPLFCGSDELVELA